VQWEPTVRTVNSFVSAFPFVVQLRDLNVLLGSDQPVHFDAEAVARRLHEPTFHAYLKAAGWNTDAIEDELRSSRVRVWGPGNSRPDDDINTDLFPKDEAPLLKVSAFLRPKRDGPSLHRWH
jgi:spermidine synthase